MAERICFLKAVAVGNGGATTGNEHEETDVKTRDEGEVEGCVSSMITQVTTTLHVEHMNTNQQEEFL